MSLLPDELYEQPNTGSVKKQSHVGLYLKKTRESYGLSLQDVSDYLNIRQGILRAIEEGNKDELPEQVYAIGFLKSYATYLNLEVDKIVKQYKLETGLTQKKVRLDVPVTPQASHLPDRRIIIAVVIAVFVLIMVISLFFGDDKQEQANMTPDIETELNVTDLKMEPLSEIEQVTVPNTMYVEEKISEMSEPDLSADKTVNDQIVEANKKSKLQPSSRATIYGAANVDARVVLKAITNSWVEIRNDEERVLLSRVLKSDDIFYVPNTGGAYLTTGNAGGIEIYVDQTYAGIAGDPGEVLKNYKITPNGLIKQ